MANFVTLHRVVLHPKKFLLHFIEQSTDCIPQRIGYTPQVDIFDTPQSFFLHSTDTPQRFQRNTKVTFLEPCLSRNKGKFGFAKVVGCSDFFEFSLRERDSYDAVVHRTLQYTIQCIFCPLYRHPNSILALPKLYFQSPE